MSQGGAARLRARLTQLLYPEGLPETAARSRAVVAGREADYRQAVAQAQALAGRAGAAWRPVMIISLGVGLVSFVAAIAMALAMAG